MSQGNGEPAEKPPAGQLFEVIWPGGLAAQAVYAAARLDLAELVADGPKTVDELSGPTGAAGRALGRLLRALTSLGLFREDEEGRFHQTPVSETLRKERPDSTHAWAIFLGSPCLWNSWRGLYDSVLTGRPAFDEVHGAAFYEHMAAHPDDAAIYDTAMSSGASMAADSVVEAYDFSGCELVVDVGGGRGALLEGILTAHPGARGILFDLPGVVAGATDLETSPVADRCEIQGGDIFDGVPPGGDAYVLKSIVHGFNDADAVRILRRCRQAIRTGGRLLLVELVLEPANEPDPQKALMDLMMLTLVYGKERKEEEFAALLRQSGFELERVVRTSRGASILEARPV